MARYSLSIHELREAIAELKHLTVPTGDGDLAHTVRAVGIILINALEAIEREFTAEDEGR